MKKPQSYEYRIVTNGHAFRVERRTLGRPWLRALGLVRWVELGRYTAAGTRLVWCPVEYATLAEAQTALAKRQQQDRSEASPWVEVSARRSAYPDAVAFYAPLSDEDCQALQREWHERYGQ